MATGESEEPENIVIPTFSTTEEGCGKEHESTITDTEWSMADPWQTSKKRPSFIKRYLTFIVCTLMGALCQIGPVSEQF